MKSCRALKFSLKTLQCFRNDGYLFSNMLEEEWQKAQEFHKYFWDRIKVFQIGPIQGTPFCIDYACQIAVYHTFTILLQTVIKN